MEKYWSKGNRYFPVAGKDYGYELFLVDEDVYSSGTNQAQRKDSRSFLESIEVRVVSEISYVEKVLERRYLKGNLKPDGKDLKCFVALVEADSSTVQ